MMERVLRALVLVTEDERSAMCGGRIKGTWSGGFARWEAVRCEVSLNLYTQRGINKAHVSRLPCFPRNTSA